MAEIKSISSSKKKKQKMCIYCGVVPAEAHEDYTCPRIAAVNWDSEGGGGVDFLEHDRWETIKQSLLSKTD